MTTVVSTAPDTSSEEPSAPLMSVLEGLGAKVIGVFPLSIRVGKIETWAPESATAPATLTSKGPDSEGSITVMGRRG